MLDAYLYDGLRTPIGRHAGKLAPLRPDDLAGEVIKEVVARNKVDAAEISDVVFQLAAASSDAPRKTAIVPMNVRRSPKLSVSHAVASIVAVVAARKPVATHCSVSCPT